MKTSPPLGRPVMPRLPHHDGNNDLTNVWQILVRVWFVFRAINPLPRPPLTHPHKATRDYRENAFFLSDLWFTWGLKPLYDQFQSSFKGTSSLRHVRESRTSTNGHTSTTATFFFGPVESPYISSYLNLSTMAERLLIKCVHNCQETSRPRSVFLSVTEEKVRNGHKNLTRVAHWLLIMPCNR